MRGTIKLIRFSTLTILGKIGERVVFRLVVRFYVLYGQKYGKGD